MSTSYRTRSGFSKAEAYKELQKTILSKDYERCCIVLTELACTPGEVLKLTIFLLELYCAKFAHEASVERVDVLCAEATAQKADSNPLRALCALAMGMSSSSARDHTERMDAVAAMTLDTSAVRFDDVGFRQAFYGFAKQAFETDLSETDLDCSADVSVMYAFLYFLLVKGSLSRALRCVFAVCDSRFERLKLHPAVAKAMQVGPRQRNWGVWIAWRALLHRSEGLSQDDKSVVQHAYDAYRRGLSHKNAPKRRPLFYLAIKAVLGRRSRGPSLFDAPVVEAACRQIHVLRAQIEDQAGPPASQDGLQHQQRAFPAPPSPPSQAGLQQQHQQHQRAFSSPPASQATLPQQHQQHQQRAFPSPPASQPGLQQQRACSSPPASQAGLQQQHQQQQQRAFSSPPASQAGLQQQNHQRAYFDVAPETPRQVWYMNMYTRYDNATRLSAYQDRRCQYDDPRARAKSIALSRELEEAMSPAPYYSTIFKIESGIKKIAPL
jgi:hypothetical protein